MRGAMAPHAVGSKSSLTKFRFWSRDHPIALQTLQVSVAAALSPLAAWAAVWLLLPRTDSHPSLGLVWYTLGLTAALNVFVLSLWFSRRSALALSRLKAALGS